jgi:phage terminase Nu1 subunit (DNA packaging protein)
MAIKTLKEVTAWYGVSERTLHNWIRDGVPVQKKGGNGVSSQLDTTEVHNWLMEREIKKRVVSSDGEQYDGQVETARLKHHQANIEDMREQEKRGELIPLDIAISDFGEKISNARAKVLVLDRSVPVKHRAKLNEAIRSVLDELSQPEIEVSECA